MFDLAERGPGSTLPIVVGIGASAGGLDALVRFFAAAPRHAGLAYVVVQHLSPDHKSLMPELLSRHTQLPVVRAQDETPVVADTIYLMPAQQDMTLAGGCLRMHARQEGGVHHPLDHFLSSLAASLGTRAIGVVLSGTGRDGTQGAIALHAAGGLVVAQDPATAGFDGMPASVIAAGVADLVLAPEDMPPSILRSLEGIAEPNSTEDLDVSAARGIIALLSRISGVDFSEYKTATLVRRAHRRRQELGLSNLAEYAALAADDPLEAERLRREILIGVSSFFRDQATFSVLERDVIPEILSRPSSDGSLRAWSMACSTGQEPYSVAMLLAEQAERLGVSVRPKIFASDIDRQAIEHAAHGHYRADAIEAVDPVRLAKFFRETADGYQVVPALRQSVVFSVHNALRDPPFSRLDLLCCRNLLIYLHPAAQRKILTRCVMAIKPGGFLVLGSSESLGELADGFDVMDARARVFRRKEGAITPQILSAGLLDGPITTRGAVTFAVEPRRIADEAFRTLAQLDSPPSVIVSPGNNIVHTTGPVDAYFALPVGQPSMDATRLARGNLSVLLTAALGKSRREGRLVEYRGVDVRLDDSGATERLDLRVAPVNAKTSDHHIISIRPSEAPRVQADSFSWIDTIDADQFETLRHELESTRENLQSAVEELETTNEELQAANEELVASNEELQATNEELQATNEELLSANAENERRIQDLLDLNADIDNLMRSTDIGTLFLDEHLAIRKFTPLVCDFISLLDRDVGRPVAHVRHTMIGLDLPELALRVIREGERRELATTSGGRHVLLRAVPYRLRSETRGVVISFVDVTELASARSQLEGVMDALPEQVAVLDAGGKIVRVNRSWRDFGAANGIDPAWEPIGAEYLGVLEHALPDAPEVDAAVDGLRRLLGSGGPEFSVEYRCDSPTVERHFFMHANSLATGGVVVSHVEVTPVIKAARDLEQSVAVYRRLFSISADPLLLVDPRDLHVVEFNQAAAAALSCTRDELAAKHLDQVLEPVDGDWSGLLYAALQLGEVSDVPARVRAQDGASDEAQPARVTLHAVEARASKLVVVAVHTPGATHLDEASALQLRSTQAQKMEALGRLAGGVAHELNNVLAAILAVCSARRLELPNDDAVAKDLEAVVAACGRGADLTRNLLGFARQSSVARDAFDLADAAREVVGLVARSTPSRISISLRTKQTAMVSGDRSQVAQALMNLCINARDAIRGNGTIVVEVGVDSSDDERNADARYACLRVSDDGTGMDASTRQRAFEPFFTTKPRGEGSGLGLSMVYGVAKSHGGWVEISSQLGVGTTVKLSLPALDAVPIASPSPSPSSPSSSPPPAREHVRGARVLLVDDDDMVRRSVSRLIATQGYIVETASGGHEALARLHAADRDAIDLVLLDISMPDLDGLAVLARLRQTFPRLPVVIYSGYADQVPQRTLDLDRYTGFCGKPVQLGELVAKFNHLLEVAKAEP